MCMQVNDENNKCVMMSQCNPHPFTIVSQCWMQIFRLLCFHYDVIIPVPWPTTMFLGEQ